jgi:putative addiction module component (TIGR02574 family)
MLILSFGQAGQEITLRFLFISTGHLSRIGLVGRSDSNLGKERYHEVSAMSAQTIAENFRMLSAEEKIRLLQDLWDEVVEDAANIPISESHRKLLDERLRQHEEDPDDLESWETARDDVLGEL